MLPDERPSGAQGFFINTRREQVQGQARARGARARLRFRMVEQEPVLRSLQAHAELLRELGHEGARACPAPEELALLEPFRDKLRRKCSASPYSPPVTDGIGPRPPVLCKRARDLLARRPAMARAASRSTVEILSFEEGFDRIIIPYINNLKRIGVDASLRRVDPAQYERRMKSFDFDMAIAALFAAPDAGRRAEELLGLGRRRHGRQLQSRRHQGPRCRRADRQGGRSQITRRAGDGRRARSTACCAPAIIGCRSGIRPSTTSPSGTSSRVPT